MYALVPTDMPSIRTTLGHFALSGCAAAVWPKKPKPTMSNTAKYRHRHFLLLFIFTLLFVLSFLVFLQLHFPIRLSRLSYFMEAITPQLFLTPSALGFSTQSFP